MARPADPHARSALIAAARAEFVKRGIRGARIEDITAACKLSKGAFYLHFKTKEALFGEQVAGFLGEMNRLVEERMAKLDAFFAEHGLLDAKDFRQRSARSEELLSLEVACDQQVLEWMWQERQVLDVLLSGSQGTEFEGVVWKMVDGEVRRVARDFHRLQASSVCRSDVSPQLFGSMIVGTYLLVGKQMSQARVKPDLHSWAKMLHRLIRDGSSPSNALSRAPVQRRTPSRASKTSTSRRRRP